MFQDPTAADYRASYFNSIIAPRPIGWVSTVDAEGRANLAPFSYFNGISASPPMVMFACNAARDRQQKDTLANVRATAEFCINLATYALREEMNLSSATMPVGHDEFELTGLEKAASRFVRAPRVAASPASMECKVVQVIDIPPVHPEDRLCSVVIGRVVGMHIDDAYLDAKGRFDVLRAQPITRLGGFQYSRVTELFELARPEVGGEAA